MLSYLLLGLFIPAFSMIKIDPGVPVTSETMVFELFQLKDCQGTRLSFAPKVLTSQVQTLKEASSPEDAFTVKSACIKKAEGGLVIGLHREGSDSTEPNVSISFAIDIHSDVCLPNLEENYFKDNVRVFVNDKASQGPSHRFTKVTLSRPFPFFVL